MKKFLVLLVVASLLLSPLALKQAAASPAGAGGGPIFEAPPAADSYIVRLTDGVSSEQAGLGALGEVFEYPQIVAGFNFAVVRPANDSQKRALEGMANGVTALGAEILSVELNGYVVLQGWPTDPMYTSGLQWGIDAGGLGMSFLKTGTTKTIAVVDTGLAKTHEDLPEVPDSDRIMVQSGRITYGSCTDSPGEGHGTHVTGIFSMLHNNGRGGAGVMAQTRRILCIKSFYGFWANWADVAWGVLYAGVEGAKFLNASWGGEYNKLVADAIGFYLAQGDSYLVAACGNSGPDSGECIFPANLAGTPGFERLISVGALNAALEPAYFSNVGGVVWAPGVDICSSLPPNNAYGCWSGTSMATPYALGVIASMLERHPLGEEETLTERLQGCSLVLPGGLFFPRWECIGAAEVVFLPLVLNNP